MAQKQPPHDHFDENKPPESTATDEGLDVQNLVDALGNPADEAAEADLAGELATEKDRVLRLQAEMQNLRQRTGRELADERRYGAIGIVRDLLPVLDNVDRAIEAAEKNTDADSLLKGFRLVRQQLTALLSQHHCHPIEAEGQEFNPDYHEAILQQPSADHAAGTVMMATQTGYRLHDRVVRPTQVIVSAGPPQESGDAQ